MTVVTAVTAVTVVTVVLSVIVATPHLPILGPGHALEAAALPRSLQAVETKLKTR